MSKKIFHAIILSLVVLTISPGSWRPSSAAENLPTGVGKWETVAYAHGALFHLAVRSPSDVWMVGSRILHWDGKNWSAFPDPPTRLNAIEVLSDTDGWAVGKEGLILRWNGETWTRVDSPVQDVLMDVDIVSSEDAWAVGDRAVLHWDGKAWSKTPYLTSSFLTGIEMLSPTQGWAVGSIQPYGWSRIYQWNGSAWFEAPLVNDDPSKIPGFNDIELISAEDGWAVGVAAYHYDGSVWSLVPIPDGSSMIDVSYASQSEAWGAGSDEFLHWNGAAWESIPAQTSWVEYLAALEMFSPTEGWALMYNWKGDHTIILKYRPPKPTLLIGQSSGKPGSYFTITGSNFPPGVAAGILVNGSPVGLVPADDSGNFVFLLDTTQAGEGEYAVSAQVESVAGAAFILDEDASLLEKEIEAAVLAVPAGIAYTQHIYLPLWQKGPGFINAD